MTDDTRQHAPDAPGAVDPEAEAPEGAERVAPASDLAAQPPPASEPTEPGTIDAVDFGPEGDEAESIAGRPDPQRATAKLEEAGSADSAPGEGAGPETVSEPGVSAAPGDQRSDAFVWHPDHAGKTFDQLREGLAQEIARDQRQHRLAMDGAEESEQDALASVVSLERKWGPYDFDWAEQDPAVLAARITEFERERERRQEMLSWADYRAERARRDDGQDLAERPAELSTGIKAVSLLLVVLLIVVILLAVWVL